LEEPPFSESEVLLVYEVIFIMNSLIPQLQAVHIRRVDHSMR
jgi:hypothetical protein